MGGMIALSASTHRHWTVADVLDLSAEREFWREYAAQQFRAGVRAGQESGRCVGHHEAILEAFTAGQRAAHADEADGFTAGWNACLDRFADLIGGRLKPAHPTRHELDAWTRHAPRCRHGGRGGSQSCQRAKCLRGPRTDFGQHAPWDETSAQLHARIQAAHVRTEQRITAEAASAEGGAA